LYNYVANDNSASQTLNYELINRYKNTKEIFEKIENKELYNIFLTKYQSELLCCLRELLRSNNKELINQCYNQICNEINNYSSQFLQLKISKQNRFSIKLICFNKKLFYIIYSLFLKLKRKR
jgi:hypothetical protein